MKIGWSVQRHVSVRGLIELLQMLSGGGQVADLERAYYSKMGHAYVDRLQSEEIFHRNVQFMKLYLEILDEKGSLMEEFRPQVRTEEDAKTFLYLRSKENIFAFQVLLEVAPKSEYIPKKTLQRQLAQGLLAKVKTSLPEEYEAKVTELRHKYGDDALWDYPDASIDRLLQIAALSCEVEKGHGGIRIHPCESMQKPLVGPPDTKTFSQRVYEIYDEMVAKSSETIVSVDDVRTLMMERIGLGAEDFDAQFRELLDGDTNIIDFSGRMGSEMGIARTNGKQVYRFTIQR